MRALVTGAGGQLGRTLLSQQPAGISLRGVDLDEVDIGDQEQVLSFVQTEKPDVIVNAAAYTAVDKAETEIEEARRANIDGPQNIALAAKAVGARVIHLSTDFVFDGNATTPYSPDSPANPVSVYGQSKYDGERHVLDTLHDRAVVLRTAWLYSEFGGNFVSTMLRLMRERDEISVVSDQLGSPTWARSVANVIFAFIANPGVHGTYHWTDSGKVSWYEFACAIQDEAIELGQIDNRTSIQPITSAEYPVAARRPAFSVLDCSTTTEALGITATPWRKNLQAMLEVIAR